MKISIASFFGSSKKHFLPKQKKRSRSISRSDTATSLSSSSSSSDSSAASDSSSSSSHHHHVRSTPKSILPAPKSKSKSESQSDPPFVSPGEVAAALRRLGLGLGLDPPSEEEVAALAAEIGGDLGLLLGLGGEAAPAAAEEELREAFAVFDADGDGRITAEELRGVLVALGDEDCSVDECRRMIGSADANGDGVVCFDDFLRLMDARR